MEALKIEFVTKYYFYYKENDMLRENEKLNKEIEILNKSYESLSSKFEKKGK